MSEDLCLRRKIKNEDYNCGNDVDLNNISKRTQNCNSQENIFNSLNEENNDIGDSVHENIEDPIKLIQTLERSDIDRIDLVKHFPELVPELGVQSNLNNSLNTELNSKLLDKVSYYIGTDWIMFARYLGLSDLEIDMIDSDNRKILEKAMKVMVRWKQINGHLTWRQIKTILKSIKRSDIIKEIEKEFAGRVAQQELIPEFGVQSYLNNSLNTELNSKLLEKVSYYIGTDWTRFARYLGLSESQIDMIDSDNQKTPLKAMEVMERWKQKNGHLTWQQKKTILKLIRRSDIIKEIEKEFAGKVAQQKLAPKIRVQSNLNSSIASNSNSLNIELNCKLFDKVSYYIGRYWSMLARYLGLSESEIDMIDIDNRKIVDKAMHVMVKWKQKNGHVTWQQIKAILKSIERDDIIKNIEKEFSELVPELGVQSHLNNSLKTELNSKLLDKVSYYIGTDWSRFACYLGLSESDINMIDSDNRKSLEKAVHVMVKWKQRNRHVTWQHLKTNLESIERYDVIREIEKKFASNIAQQVIVKS